MSGNGAETAAILDRLSRRVPDWATETGPGSLTVLSSRVRLARNLASVPFPGRSTPAQQKQVVARIRRVAREAPGLDEASFLDVSRLEADDLDFLVERRLVSRDLATGSRVRGVILTDGESFTIMANEEDHLRLQSLYSGLRLGEALDRANEVDDALDARLEFAFDREFGYLTACPTNVGTGMRASVLAHLPALVLTRRAKKVIQGVSAMGMSVRGFYGEGTEVMGNFFQISNQTSLGKGENEIVSRLDEVVRQVLGYEEEAQDIMWSRARLQLEDKIYRAYGTLLCARSITAEEVVSLASAVRFGLALELGGLCSLSTLNRILVASQPGHVIRAAGRPLEQDERRQARATLVRSLLAGSDGEPSGNGRGIASEDPPTPGEED